ncbi:MAG: orotidine-5'-phosphate decarboxylase, partial [Candidatus Omnitrophica bacterium]|nr:orotidine-5'-phosphate decarboxylase [Candidatus Omnitrophota bacterium]
AIQMIHAHHGEVFLDLKFHDIPNTVGAACEAAARLKVFMVNVHVSGGKPMLFKAVQSIHQTAEKMKITPPRLLGVTVLTSMTESDLKDVGVKKKLKQQVQDLSVLAKNCGLDGVVASGQEIELIRKAAGSDFLIVTPGVRPIWAAHGDQRRVITPREAIQRGADFIVVGRPITEHAKPRIAAERIVDEMGVKS